MNNQLLFPMAPEMLAAPALHDEVAVELHRQEEDGSWLNLGLLFEGMVVAKPTLLSNEVRGINVLPHDDQPQPPNSLHQSGHPIFFKSSRLEGFWRVVNPGEESELKVKLRYNVRSLGAIATNR